MRWIPIRQNLGKSNRNRPLEGNAVIRKALEEALDLVGESGKRILISELVAKGTYSPHDSSSLSLEKIASVLSSAFGSEVSEILMESVLIRMDEICSGASKPKKDSIC
ncbi:MAG: hypothetical protein MN733_06365 [Nitrososphaera sp.]|nr:hypothetical protein [Nitrososphaera sp.]